MPLYFTASGAWGQSSTVCKGVPRECDTRPATGAYPGARRPHGSCMRPCARAPVPLVLDLCGRSCRRPCGSRAGTAWARAEPVQRRAPVSHAVHRPSEREGRAPGAPPRSAASPPSKDMRSRDRAIVARIGGLSRDTRATRVPTHDGPRPQLGPIGASSPSAEVLTVAVRSIQGFQLSKEAVTDY